MYVCTYVWVDGGLDCALGSGVSRRWVLFGGITYVQASSVDLLLACVHEYVHAGAEYEVAVVAEGQRAIGTCIGRATLCTLAEISRVG